jgi:nitroreductase
VDVREAISSRRSIRDFLPDPVPGDVIRRVLAQASRSPSGGNVQPWHLDVVGGELLQRIKDRMAALPAPAPAKPPEYDIYPQSLWSPYRDRRFKCGEDMYALLGIARDDRAARLRWFARNYQFFGAPLALFCTVDRRMGQPQWSDLGMFLQSLMLLLRAEGLDSCAQEAWSVYHEEIRELIDIPPERMLFCGMAIGRRNPDHPINRLVTDRAPLEEFTHFHGV